MSNTYKPINLKLLLIAVLFSLPFFSHAQPARACIKILEKNHGFQDLKVGSLITDLGNKVEQAKDHENYLHGVQYYQVIDTNLLKAGKNIKISKIWLGVYQQKITYIHLYLDPSCGKSMLTELKSNYGAGLQPNRRMKKYHWKSSHVLLRLNLNDPNNAAVLYADRDLNEQVFAQLTNAASDEPTEFITKAP
ncbi:hypothetical protein KHS38_05125 [Mucilaginibacter sp. Bleaf8]|uniref:hypothetical protein n=1 Tax=Mucilaginibacter sp. Bleaf8 TaxID=2834430 RepID=UPI001BCB176C|nr:hypothetical protein [Mucilaginibacter sp. Bleaf8]MBS7563778.1 hypothetical protein [Mucilaginibacter sp. Bleaf8]